MKAKTTRKPSSTGVNGSTGDFTSLTQKKYDERFRRMWNFYLAGSEAAFDGLGFRVAQIVVENAASLLARPVVQSRSGTRHLLDRFGERKPNVVMSTIGIEIHARCNRHARFIQDPAAE